MQIALDFEVFALLFDVIEWFSLILTGVRDGWGLSMHEFFRTFSSACREHLLFFFVFLAIIFLVFLVEIVTIFW